LSIFLYTRNNLQQVTHVCSRAKAQAYSAFQHSGTGKSELGFIRGFTLPLTPG